MRKKEHFCYDEEKRVECTLRKKGSRGRNEHIYIKGNLGFMAQEENYKTSPLSLGTIN